MQIEEVCKAVKADDVQQSLHAADVGLRNQQGDCLKSTGIVISIVIHLHHLL